ncbi:MAG TPA: type I polyketide synthase, partial [Anaerolineaceae bacterium]
MLKPGNPQTHEPIAIIGIGCRFPGGVHDLDSFWQLLREERFVIGEIPPSRFDLKDWYDPQPATPGKVMSKYGGYLDRIDEMDAEFFGISPREAERLDPQQRLLLEVAWEAVENAGIPVETLIGSQTGVFVGQWLHDFETRLIADPANTDFYMTTGSGRYASSGRLSYFFGFQGPSLTIDTACSSSLVAVHAACQSLRAGESRMALAAAVNIILQPHITVAYSQSRMMAPDGKCKFGDAAADGYVRSEGAAALMLKRLPDALADNDPILGLIIGSAVNNDGQSSGFMTTPGGAGQEDMLRKAYESAGIMPEKVQYVEAHGTGTSAGDPVEIGALSAVLGEGRSPDQPLWVGSVKTNFGHTESAAGLAGLIKTVLALKYSQIPRSLHFQTPSPRIPWNEIPLKIADRLMPWPEHAGAAIAGVSAFGIAGTNAHIVLQEAPAHPIATPAQPGAVNVLPLSAQTPDALRKLAGRYAETLRAGKESLSDILYTASRRRSHHPHRLAATADSPQELAEALAAFAQDDPLAPVTVGAARAAHKVVFIFPGQGGQWLGMGRKLHEADSAFRAAIQRCEEAFRPYVSWSLVEQLHASENDSRLAEIDVVQPVLFAVEIALAETFRAWGIEPDAVVGHSMGEAAAAFIAGALSLEDAARVICTRSRLMKRVSGKGGMAVVELTLDAAQAALAGYEDRLSIAVNNGPRASVLSGDPAALEEVSARLQARGVFVRPVKVDVAAHSPHMDPLQPELVQALGELQPRAPAVPLYSTVTGALADFALDAAYWGRNLRQPVLFATAVEHLARDGYSVFIECSPHPVLLGAIDQSNLEESQRVTVAAMRRHEDELHTLRAGLSRLYCQGAPIHWERLYPAGQVAALPTYPFQREHYWAKEAELGASSSTQRSNRLIGAHFESASQPGVQIWQASLNVESPAYLADHRVNGAVLLPAAAFVEMALEAADSAGRPLALANFDLEQALPLLAGKTYTLQLITATDGSFEITSRAGGESEWMRHARGRYAPLSAAAALDLA